MEALLTVIGTIASLIGAIIAYRQAAEAKKSANEAESIKNQIISHRTTSELSQLQTRCRKAQNAMAKYGPAASSSSLQGVDKENDAKEVQEFILLVKEHRGYFGPMSRNQADILCDKTNRLLNDFSEEMDYLKQKELGTKILLHINEFAAVIKKLVDLEAEKFTGTTFIS